MRSSKRGRPARGVDGQVAGETTHDMFDFPTVSAWAHGILQPFQAFQLHDAVFDRDAVVIRAPDGAQFEITMEAWTDLEATERAERLQKALTTWEEQNLPRRPGA